MILGPDWLVIGVIVWLFGFVLGAAWIMKITFPVIDKAEDQLEEVQKMKTLSGAKLQADRAARILRGEKY